MAAEKELYTPAAPFAAAIQEWTSRHDRRMAPPGAKLPGIQALAHLSGIETRTLRAYTTGERPTISLTNADRLALALNIGLWVLADEFTSRDEAYRQATGRRPSDPLPRLERASV